MKYTMLMSRDTSGEGPTIRSYPLETIIIVGCINYIRYFDDPLPYWVHINCNLCGLPISCNAERWVCGG